MRPQDALTDLDLAFRQLEFTIKLLSFCDLGRINPTEFDTDHIVDLSNERLHFPTGHFSDLCSLQRAAGTSVLIAMSASALVLDDAFNTFGMRPNPDASDNSGQLRALVYMVRCAYAHGIAAPLWEVRGKYLRAFTINVAGFPLTLDLCKLHAQPFEITQIGGYANWYRIRNEALVLLK
jgi:hypothetical protein